MGGGISGKDQGRCSDGGKPPCPILGTTGDRAGASSIWGLYMD